MPYSTNRLNICEAVGQSNQVVPPIPKSAYTPEPEDTSTGMLNTISAAISQSDYDRLMLQGAKASMGRSYNLIPTINYVAISVKTIWF